MMTIGDAPVRVALLGCGVVGSQVARILVEQADDLAERVGRPLELVGIGVRRPSRGLASTRLC
jgi:homoserine dehydrogenase